MRKLRMAAILLIMVYFAGMFNAFPASAREYLTNGGFENQSAGWSKTGSDISFVTEGQKTGSYALKLSSGSGSAYVMQVIESIPQGSEFTLTIHVRIESLTTSGRASVKLEFYNTAYLSEKSETYRTVSKGIWQEYKINFTMPAGSDKLKILLRLFDGGEIYYDDISLDGPDLEHVPAAGLEKPIPGAVNIISNSDFETVSGSTPTGWTAFPSGGVWGTNRYAKIDSTLSYSETNSIKLEAVTDGTYPYIYQQVSISPATSYQVTGWCNSTAGGSTATFFVYYYDSGGTKIGDYTAPGLDENTIMPYRWVQRKAKFTTPAKAAYARIYVRTSNLLYIDDLECFALTYPAGLAVQSDEEFYYADWEEVNITIESTSFAASRGGTSADVELEDKSKNLRAFKRGVPLAGSFDVHFKISEINPSYGERITVYAVLKNSQGAEIERQSKTIYFYDRPTHLTADGRYKNHDGTIFNPVFAYHVNTEHYPYCKEAGINVVQTSNTKSVDSMMERLNTISSYGLRALVTLYPDMKPAGHPDNKDLTITMVEAIKNHPAVFAYAIMDEPSALGDPFPWLFESYTTIRDIDAAHPVYLVESSVMYAYYKSDGKCVDILATDPYPANRESYMTYVAKYVKLAGEAVNYRKPVYSLLQTFDWRDFFPTGDMARHMIYQSFLSGAKSVGYYCFEKAADSADLHETGDLWNGLVKWGKYEANDTFDVFVNGKYKLLSGGIFDGPEYKIAEYEKGKYIHGVLVNMTNSDYTVTREDDKGLEPIVICGGDESTFSRNDNAFSITVKAGGVLSYRYINNLLDNGDFEKNGGSLSGWNTYGSGISSSETGRMGSGVKIAADSGSTYILKEISGLSGGEDLLLKAYVKIKELKAGGYAAIKVEFWDDSTSTDYLSDSYSIVSEDWQEQLIRIHVPENIIRIKILLRLFGGGEVYFDDVTVTPVQKESTLMIYRNGVMLTGLSGGDAVLDYAHGDVTSYEEVKVMVLVYSKGDASTLKSLEILSGAASADKPLCITRDINIHEFSGGNYLLKALVWDEKQRPNMEQYVIAASAE